MSRKIKSYNARLYWKGRLNEPEKFLYLYKKHEGNAKAAMMEMRPDFSEASCGAVASGYMSYIDPLKLFLPRNGRKIKMENLEIEGKNHGGPVVAKRSSEELFRALYEKYGADGMKSAMLAVAEIYPRYKQRGAIAERARKLLATTGVISDLINALEARGVEANMVAEKIQQLLMAKRKVRTIIKGDVVTEVEEIDASAIDKGLTHALKSGVGGGYAPDRVAVGIKDFSLGKALEELDKKIVEHEVKE